jgi:fructokinase
VFAVILGTGCGGGIVVDGQLLEGANGIAGEWGHLTLPWPKADEYPGPQCWCGRNSCIETWVSGTGVARDHLVRTTRSLTAESIVQAAQRGDSEALLTLDRFIDRLGRALAMICNLFDPDVFVLGGGLSNVSELYDLLPQSIRPYVFGQSWQARLLPAAWGDSSGVRGAARLWPPV